MWDYKRLRFGTDGVVVYLKKEVGSITFGANKEKGTNEGEKKAFASSWRKKRIPKWAEPFPSLHEKP